MCTPADRMRKFHFILKNKAMKSHLALPPSTTSPIYYRQNTVNKTLTLPFYQFKGCLKSSGCYRKRAMKCFPTAGPFSCPPMLPRTKFAERPSSPNDVVIPTHKALIKAYTLKVDKRFLRKPE